MTDATPQDHSDAEALAEEAGELLLGIRSGIGTEYGAKVAMDRGDAESHALLAAAIAARHPGDAILSEEARDDPARLAASRVWIIDPLDGTREFGEPPRTDWAVHVALVVHGRLVAGAVALPGRGCVLGTATAPSVPPAAPESPLQVLVSRTRPPDCAERVALALGARLVGMGSAGAKAMAVVLGEADVYLHDGGQYEWDSAAPVAVARAAGLHVSRLDGSSPEYNQPDPWLPDMLICRPELASTALAELARGPA